MIIDQACQFKLLEFFVRELDMNLENENERSVLKYIARSLAEPQLPGFSSVAQIGSVKAGISTCLRQFSITALTQAASNRRSTRTGPPVAHLIGARNSSRLIHSSSST